MTRYTRHQLKEDRFTETAAESLSWMRAHQGKLVVSLVAAVIALAASIGGWFYMQEREQRAGLELTRALRTMNTSLRDPGTPPSLEFPTFASAKERGEAARKQFKEVAEKYKHTHSGGIASYFEAVAGLAAGDSANAEKRLQELAASRDKDLASLAKFKLASVFRGSNREDQAVAIYKQLIEHPTRMVTKPMAQLELAAIYESKDPAEAKRIYQVVQSENPATPAAEIASNRLTAPPLTGAQRK